MMEEMVLEGLGLKHTLLLSISTIFLQNSSHHSIFFVYFPLKGGEGRELGQE